MEVKNDTLVQKRPFLFECKDIRSVRFGRNTRHQDYPAENPVKESSGRTLHRQNQYKELIKRFGHWLPVLLIFIPMTIFAQPKALFTAKAVQGCSPFRAEFVNQSAGAVHFTWTLGNGNNSILQNPQAIYNIPGVYTVKLVAYDSFGRTDSLILTDYIRVFRNPEAMFSLSTSASCAGDTIRLSDLSRMGDAGIASWQWDPGDGTLLSGNKPMHIYRNEGIYAVGLAITDSNGCRSSHKVSGAVKIYGLPRLEIQSTGNLRCQAPASVAFKARCTGQGPFMVQWNFGDGTAGSGSQIEHAYQQAGKFPVWCAVTDANGCKSKTEITDLVRIQQPKINFGLAAGTICAGGVARFEAASEPNDGTGVYTWTFDDGDSAHTATVSKTFPLAGNYGATLTYTWDGCTASVSRPGSLRVTGGPSGKILPSDTTVCRKKSGRLAFSVAGQGFDSLVWLSDTGILEMPQFNKQLIYPTDTANGLYTIRARLISSTGCGEKTITTTYRLRGPIPDLLYTNKEGCLPVKTKIEYTGTGDAPIVSYKWSIPGLGATSDKRDISVINNKFGVTPVFLSVQDKNGCTADVTGMIMAGKRFPILFEVPRKTICVGEPLKIYNKSPYKGIDSVVFTYSWFDNDTFFCGTRDSFFATIRDIPGKKYRLSFTVNSFGCTNRITPDKGPEITLLGPLARGIADPFCEEDSVKGFNTSLDYTSTSWRFLDEKGNPVYQADKRLSTSLNKKVSVSIIAVNSINKCKDSIEIPLNVDPQVAAFDYTYDCRTGDLSARSTYESKFPDKAYQWELLNLTDSVSQTFTGRRIHTTVKSSGRYELSLRIRNLKFECTRPQKVYFGRPDSAKRSAFSVVTDRGSCFPVNITLRDPWAGYWNHATWKIGDSLIIPDTSREIRIKYQQQLGRIPVYLQRWDPVGCDVTDTVYLDIRLLQGKISVDQDYSDCRQTKAIFTAQVERSTTDDSLQFEWDFGHRTSALQRDTIHQRPGSMHIKLSVRDKTGCYSRDSMNITLYQAKPKAAFYTPDSLNLCPPLALRFIDSSTTRIGSIVAWHWKFGDGAGSTLRYPSKLYLTPGRYTVSLEIQSSTGCRDTLTMPDLVWVKGPTGEITFSELQGCHPLKTSFNTRIQGQLARIDVDFGDGQVLHQSKSDYIYRKPGKYVPRMILTDSAGCRFSPPVRDTITVYPTPEVNLQGRNLCRGEKLLVCPAISSADKIDKIRWQVDNGKPSENDCITLMSDVSGVIRVRVNAATAHTCADTAEARFRVYGIEPSLTAPKTEVCLGEKLLLREDSKSDTTIVQRQLWIGSKEASTNMPLSFRPTARGILPMRYRLTDALGCTAEINDAAFLKSGDTLNPPAQQIYYSSVTDDFHTETRFSASLEPDFKNQVLYAWLNGQWIGADSSANRQDTLMVVQNLNTLRHAYCHRVVQQNFCGRRTAPLMLIPHCTVEVGSRADTNASDVYWTPYSGWKQVASYRIWRRDHNSTLPFALIDSVDGNTLRYKDLSVYCHRTYDYRIQALEKGGNMQYSMSDTTTCSPIHHLPLPSPEIWRTTVEENRHVLTEFGMMVPHKYPISEYALLRSDGAVLTLNAAHKPAGLLGIEDFDTRVQDQYYTYKIRATDVCGTVSEPGNPGRSILLKVSNDSAFKAVLNWNNYIRWNEGVEKYLIERRLTGSAFLPIGYTDSGTTSYIDADIPKTCASGVEYRVTAVRRQPLAPDSGFHVVSRSNHAAFTPEIRFYTPNAFTPDGNRLNEHFQPKGVFYAEYELAVYNRWGEKLFQDKGCEPAWDGNYMGQPAPEGVYAWRITARDYSGRSFEFSGIVHLLR